MNPLQRYAEWCLTWAPGRDVAADASGLAEALRAWLVVDDPVTLGVADEAGAFVVATWTAQSASPTYWTDVHVPLGVEPLSSPTLWTRAAMVERAVYTRRGGGQWACRIGEAGHPLGIVTVRDARGSRRLGRRLEQASALTAVSLLAVRQAQRRQLEHRLADAAARVAATYALSERLDDQAVMNGMAAAIRQAMQADRCVLVEYTRPDGTWSRHFAAGSRHLWEGVTKTPPTPRPTGLASRLAEGRPGQIAGGLVAWIPIAVEDSQGLTLVVDNLISEGPIAPLEDPAWDGIRHVVAGFWRLWRGLEAVRRQAERDELTTLYNRTGGLPFLRDWVARAASWSVPVTLVFMDLDHFKGLNDQYGHEVGDMYLKAVGRWMSQHLRPTDIALRYGGDEFVVLLPEVSATYQPQVVDRLVEGLQELEPVGGLPRVSVSAGAAVAPQQAADLTALLRAADHALYEAKAKGGHQWTLAASEARAESV